MDLNEICSNEKFAKGELYGSRNQRGFIHIEDLFIDGKLIQEDILMDYNSDGKKVCESKLCLEAIIADNWKLYEFIDGKMVECVECKHELRSRTLLYPDHLNKEKCIKCNKELSDQVGEVNGMIAEEVCKLDIEITECKHENVASYLDGKYNFTDTHVPLVAKYECLDCGKQDVSKKEADECKHKNKFKLEFSNPMICSCVDCKKVFTAEEVAYIIGKRSQVMQPTEAARWMRENPGKAIEAVENTSLRFCWDAYNKGDAVVYILFSNARIENTWTSATTMSSQLTFFAYTYRVVEVQ